MLRQDDSTEVISGTVLATSSAEPSPLKSLAHELLAYRSDATKLMVTVGDIRKLSLARGATSADRDTVNDVILPNFVALMSSLIALQELCSRAACTLVAKNPVSCDRFVGIPGALQLVLDLVAHGEHTTADECASASTHLPAALRALSLSDSCETVCFAEDRIGRRCGARWLLCALVDSTSNFARQLSPCTVSALLQSQLRHLASPSDEEKAACCWLIHCLAGKFPTVPSTLLELNADAQLVGVLTSSNPSTACLAAWAIRAAVGDRKDIAKAYFDRPAVREAVLSLMTGDAADHQSGGLWLLSGLVSADTPSSQDDVREWRDGVLFTKAISMLRSPSVIVQCQAAVCVYNFCAKHAVNQQYAVEHGAHTLLHALLPKRAGVVRVTEKALATLLCIVLKHSANQLAVCELPDLVKQTIALLTCSSTRIQGLAAGLVRTLVAEQPTLQARFTAHGVLPPLVELLRSTDTFTQEQSIAALYNMIVQHSLNKTYLLCLPVEAAITGILCDSAKPSRLTLQCAIMVLYSLCEADDAFKARLGANEALVNALLRLCHVSCGCTKLRAHADRLLKTIAPSAHEQRPARSPEQVLAALMTVYPTSSPSPAAPACFTDCQCPICIMPLVPSLDTDDRDTTMGSEPTPCDAVAAHDIVALPGCLHKLHRACLVPWIKSGKDSCPTCRKPIIATIHSMIGVDAAAAVRAATAAT